MATEPRKVRTPCLTCPWRLDKDASDIPGFDMQKAENLATTVGAPGAEAPLGSPRFACHQSTDERHFDCAGWLAVEGYNNLTVRIAVSQGLIPPEALEPGADWPELHDSFAEVIEKLRTTDPEGA